MPNHFVFHYVNSWEEKNSQGEDIVILWGCSVENISLNFNEEHPFYGQNIQNVLTKMTFNMSTGKSTFEKLHPEYSVEFPVISQELMGYETRYTYLSQFHKGPPPTKDGQENMYFKGFLKYDLKN